MDDAKVTASEVQRAFGALSDRALREPITITKQGRDHLVVLSAEEYARLKRRDRQSGYAWELPDEWVKAIEEAEVPSAFNYLDAELDDSR